MASHNFLILSGKFKSDLNLVCNRFAAEFNRLSGPSQATAFPKILPGFPRKSSSCNPQTSILNKMEEYKR
jgi:hypothetical protein